MLVCHMLFADDVHKAFYRQRIRESVAESLAPVHLFVTEFLLTLL